MKKFTALMLVVLMVVAMVPFSASAATWTKVDTAAEFAAMADGNYWLTADIDLSKATWTTMAEFKGTLNGNGHTITVPKDAPIFDKLSGTVKNVNLKGAMSLDDADRSAFHVAGNHNSHPLGVLANYAQGATVENVHTAVELTYASGRTAKPSAWTSVGGLIGIAMADYTIEEKDGTKNVKFGDGTTIKNVSNTGKMNLDFAKDMNGNRDNLGGILAGALGYVDLSLVLVSAEMTVQNTGGNKGGIVGYVYAGYESKLTGASANVETEEMAVTFTDCLYNGSYKISGNTGERWAGIAGYAHNAKFTNCVNEGTGEGGNVAGLIGYGNCGKDNGVHCIIVENSVALGAKGCGSWTSVKAAKENDTKFGHLEYKNIPLLEENKLNSAKDTDKPAEVQTNVVTYKTKPEVRTAFLANGASNFEVKNDVLTLKMPTFTPEADPADKPVTPAPTGDMTVALVATALVSLAAVTVIAKKKVTE